MQQSVKTHDPRKKRGRPTDGKNYLSDQHDDGDSHAGTGQQSSDERQ